MSGPVSTAVGAGRSALGAVFRWSSSLLARARRRPSATLSGSVVGVAVVGLVVAMFLADGFRATNYDLADSAVWVTNARASSDKSAQFGRINHQIDRQDADKKLSNEKFDTGTLDIVQDGTDVFVGSAKGWTRIVPADLSLEDTPIETDGQVRVGAGRLSVLGTDGALWIAKVDEAASLQLKGGDREGADASSDPLLDAGAGSQLEVSRRGDVAVLSVESGTITVFPRGSSQPQERNVPEVKGATGAQLSFAGSEPVVLADGELVVPGKDAREVSGSEAQLQLSSDDEDHVLIATNQGVQSYPIGGGAPERLDKPGATPQPARPVSIAGVTYAAWGGPTPAVFYRNGAQQRTDRIADALRADSTLPDEPSLRWRVNRSNVVLNELNDGVSLIATPDGLVQSDRWTDPDKTPPTPEQTKSDEKSRSLDFDRKKNQPPKVEPDDVGARPGVPTIISVLANDSDVDSDVLTVRLVGPDIGAELVQGAQAVQLTPPADATGTITFRYKAFDGTSESEEDALVTVTLYDGSSPNQPPELRDPAASRQIEVGAGASAQYKVLDDYVDPEGDPMVLADASVGAEVPAQVSAQPNGVLTYVDTGRVAATHQVAYTVTDAPLVPSIAPASNDDDQLPVTVHGLTENLPPVARNDFATVTAGGSVVVWPLRNDTDPEQDDLSFTLLPKGDGLPSGVVDNHDGSVTVTASADRLEPIVFGYEVSDGAETAQARIRVDVAAADDNRPPAAGLDLVVLPQPAPGRTTEVTVDLLANDFSPQGAVLLVAGLDVDGPAFSDLGLQVGVLEHRRLRVTATGALSSTQTLRYQLSDGVQTSWGTIAIVQSNSSSSAAPIAIDDEVTVRVEDIVSVPVLANDVSPTGGKLYLLGLDETPPRDQGLAFVSGSRIRFLAPATPAELTLGFRISDSPVPGAGREVPGVLRVRIVDPDENRAPRPTPVEQRVLAGSRVKITVPLFGVDPDGDSVTLVGLGVAGDTPQAPKLGRITEVGTDFLVYEAFADSSGTDSFSYRVSDSGGLFGEANVRVGVAPHGPNSDPVAVTDLVTLRPGVTTRLDPTLNDYDSDGDEFGLIAPLGAGADALGASIPEDDTRVELTVPDSGTNYQLGYTIEDQLGGRGNGVINITVDPDADGVAPIARDDIADVAGATADRDQRVSVKVLDNDEDPDGDSKQLKVKALNGRGAADGQQLVVTVKSVAQVVPYQIEDEQGLTAMAIVRVPAAGADTNLPPVLKDRNAVVKVKKGETTATIDITEYVEDPEGADVFLAGNNSVVGSRITARPTSNTTIEVETDRATVSGAVTFIATDSASGEGGADAALTLPVEFTSNIDRLPRFTVPSTTMTVSQDGERSRLDLAKLASDPEDQPMSFELDPAGAPKGVSVDLEGSVLVATSEPSKELPKGSITVTVTGTGEPDPGETPPPVFELRVDISVVATTKPVVVIPPIQVDAERDKATTVKVFEGVLNPFPDTPLQLNTVSGASGSVEQTDDSITYTPAEVGSTTITFTALDKVGRNITGTVAFTVTAPPGRPGRPTVEQVSSRSVRVAWAAAEQNGLPITDYTVTSADGSSSTSCGTALSCVVQGLTPGTTYTFQVVATNDRGAGDPSERSGAITPDVCPAAPKNVTLRFDRATNPPAGGQLMASWDVPDNDGTAITGYRVRITPPADSGPEFETRSTELTLTGLENGVEHTITVEASNSCEDTWGDAGESDSAIPFGVPDAPTDARGSTGRRTGRRRDPAVVDTAHCNGVTLQPRRRGDAVHHHRGERPPPRAAGRPEHARKEQRQGEHGGAGGRSRRAVFVHGASDQRRHQPLGGQPGLASISTGERRDRPRRRDGTQREGQRCKWDHWTRSKGPALVPASGVRRRRVGDRQSVRVQPRRQQLDTTRCRQGRQERGQWHVVHLPDPRLQRPRRVRNPGSCQRSHAVWSTADTIHQRCVEAERHVVPLLVVDPEPAKRSQLPNRSQQRRRLADRRPVRLSGSRQRLQPNRDAVRQSRRRCRTGQRHGQPEPHH